MNKPLLIFILFLAGTISILGQNRKTKTTEADPVTVTYKKKPVNAGTTNQNKSGVTSGDKSSTSEPIVGSTRNIPPRPGDNPDTIIKLGGKQILCNVLKINATTVSYTKLGQSQNLEIPRKDIEKIYYRNGKKEVFNKPVLQMIDERNWQAVLVTENGNDVEGLYKCGLITANAASGSRSPKAAKTSATIRLQKKAAKMGALIVFITNSEMKGGYGEIPGWELEGIAYSDTPPADTAAVSRAIRLALEKRSKERIKKAQGVKK